MSKELKEIQKAFKTVREALEAARPKPLLAVIGELSKALRPYGSLVSSKMTEPEPSEGARREEAPSDEPSMTPIFRRFLKLRDIFPIRGAIADSLRAISEATKRKIEADAQKSIVEAKEKAKWLPKGSLKLRK